MRRRANGTARGSFEKTSPSIRDPNHAEILKVGLLHPSANPRCERGNIGRKDVELSADMGVVARSGARRNAVRFDLRSNLMQRLASIEKKKKNYFSLDG